VDFNPSAVVYGPGRIELADLADCQWALKEVFDEISQHVRVRTPIGEMGLSRIDVSRDVPFVGDIQGVLQVGLSSSFSPRVKAYPHIGPNGMESVICRTAQKGRGGFIVYNKSLKEGCDGDVLRFEARAQRSHLRETCPTWSDVNEGIMYDIFDGFLGRYIENLRLIPHDSADEILASPDKKTFITLLGLDVLARAGHTPVLGDYWHRKAKKFRRNYPHNEITDLLGGPTDP
jgi:hypothetical protein